MLLEICANSYQSAINAQEAGAHRIELCSELALGGITPSYGLIEKVIEQLTIPVFVLIRPRSGDFTYTAAEFDVMLRDIAGCKKLGVQGIVSGVLQKDGSIDTHRTKELIKASKGMSFTFHRAFDWVPDCDRALTTLIGLGADRILSSGQHTNAQEGLSVLIKLLHQAKNDITILPGGGINANNIGDFKAAGFTECHASASVSFQGVSRLLPMQNLEILMKDQLTVSDPKKIKSLLITLSSQIDITNS